MIESDTKPERDVSPDVDDMLDIPEYDGPDPTEDFDGSYWIVYNK